MNDVERSNRLILVLDRWPHKSIVVVVVVGLV